MAAKNSFIPAAHYHALTPYYGGFMRLFFKKHYLKIADFIQLKDHENLLDVGCGPGQILSYLHRLYPDHELAGLDIDPKILAIAQKNLPSLQLIESSAAILPFPSEKFDVIISTLMIHHLETADKEKMINEVYRILKPSGRFFLFDFSAPNTLFGKIFTKIFRKSEHLDDAIEGKYRVMMEKAGFKEIQSLYQAYGMMELLRTEKL